MSPRKGIVIGSSAGSMTVRTTNGATTCVSNVKKFKLGDTAYIMWDYTNDRPRDVMTDEEHNHDPESDRAFNAPEFNGDWLPDEHWI